MGSRVLLNVDYIHVHILCTMCKLLMQECREHSYRHACYPYLAALTVIISCVCVCVCVFDVFISIGVNIIANAFVG